MYIYQEKQKTEEKSAFYCASSLLLMFSFARMPHSMSFRVFGQNYNSEYLAILIFVQTIDLLEKMPSKQWRWWRSYRRRCYQ